MFRLHNYSSSKLSCILIAILGLSGAKTLDAQQFTTVELIRPNKQKVENAFEFQESFKLKKPPLSSKKIVIELLAGEAVVFSIAALFLDKEQTNGIGGLFTSSLLVYGGTLFGSSAVVYSIGSMGDETSSFKKTLRGSLITSGIVALIATLVTKDNDTRLAMGFAAMAIGATISFNLNRRYK
jgi:hypothetical protein